MGSGHIILYPDQYGHTETITTTLHFTTTANSVWLKGEIQTSSWQIGKVEFLRDGILFHTINKNGGQFHSDEHTFNNLTSNTTYTFSIIWYQTNGQVADRRNIAIATNKVGFVTPDLSLMRMLNDRFIFAIPSQLPSNVPKYRFRLIQNGNVIRTIEINNPNSSATLWFYEIDGLAPNTVYTVNFWALNNDGSTATGIGYPNISTLGLLSNPNTPQHTIRGRSVDITINSPNGKAFIDVEPLNQNSLITGFTNKELDFYYEISCDDTDDLNWIGRNQLVLKNTQNVGVRLYFQSGINSNMRTRCIQHVQNITNEINTLVQPINFIYEGDFTFNGTRDNSLYKINIYVGDKSTWNNYHVNSFSSASLGLAWVYRWDSGDWAGMIAYSHLLIDSSIAKIEPVITHEFFHALGFNHTSTEGDSSIFRYSYNEIPNRLTSLDRKVIDLHYNKNLPQGFVRELIANRLARKFTLQKEGTGNITFNLNNLRANADYRVCGWISDFNHSTYSKKSGYVSFKTQGGNFKWHNAGKELNGSTISGERKLSGKVFYVTATEWNSLQGNINERRLELGKSPFNFTLAQANSIFFATMFNQMRTALSDLSPTTLFPSSKNKDDVINADDLNGLMDSFNSV